MKRYAPYVVTLAIGAFPSDAYTQTQSAFEAGLYLDMCSGFVAKDAPLGLVGDTACLQSVDQLCAANGSRPVDCVVQKTNWLEDQAHGVWGMLPEDMRQGRTAPFDAETLHEYGVLPDAGGFAWPDVDCRKNHEIGIPTEVNCAYQDAVAGWLVARALQRLSHEFPEELKEDD